MKLKNRISYALRILRRGMPQRVPQVPGTAVESGLADRQGDYDAMVKAFHGWVYKAANFRGTQLGTVERLVQMRTGSGEFEDVADNHPLIRLLAQPNPFETGAFFFWRAQLLADLTGNCYLLQVPNMLGQTTELWVLDPRNVTIVPHGKDVISHYIYRVGTQKIRLDPRYVIHYKYPNPADWYYGASPLMAAAWDVDIDKAAKEHQRNFFRHNPAPRVAIESDSFLDDSSVERIRASVVARMRDPNRAGEPFIGHLGAKFKELQLTPQEVNYLATRENARDEIATIYGVPASVLGIAKDVNRANAEANHFVFAKFVLEPLARLWDDVLTLELAREYDPRLVVRHENVVPKDRAAEREDMRARIESGVTAINEERARLSYDPVKGGDEPLVGVGRIPVSQVGFDPLPADGSKALAPASDVPVEQRSARASEWQQAASLQIKHERRMTQRMRAFYRRQAVAVLKTMRRSMPSAQQRDGGATVDEDAITLTMDAFEEPLRELGVGELLETMPDAWSFAMTQIDVDDNAWRMSRSSVERVMAKSIEKIVGTNQTTKQSILETLRAGLEANETDDQLRDRVLDVFDEADKVRARRIAMTTTTQAVNASMQLAWEDESDLVEKKEWLSSRDGKVRDAHAAADGKRVKLNQAFMVGGELLRYPGDPIGSAENVINCRCFIKPVLKQ